jgi:hypothetical protein
MLIFDNRFVLGCIHLVLSMFFALNYLSNIIEGNSIVLSVFFLIPCMGWAAYAIYLIHKAINDNG